MISFSIIFILDQTSRSPFRLARRKSAVPGLQERLVSMKDEIVKTSKLEYKLKQPNTIESQHSNNFNCTLTFKVNDHIFFKVRT